MPLRANSCRRRRFIMLDTSIFRRGGRDAGTRREILAPSLVEPTSGDGAYKDSPIDPITGARSPVSEPQSRTIQAGRQSTQGGLGREDAHGDLAGYRAR